MVPGTNGDRDLPFSEDSEKGVICSLLLSPSEVADLCVARLSPDAFYIPANRIVYELAMELGEKNKPIDYVTLKQALKDRNQLEEIGGKEYLSSLYAFVPSPANANGYIDTVREKYVRRRLILACKGLETRCYQQEEEVEPLLIVAEQEVSRIVEEAKSLSNSDNDELITVTDLMSFERNNDPDNVLGNRWLCRGDSLIIGGATGIGKSSFIMQALVHWALGRAFFGIRTVRPLTCLIIQAENNRGDLAIAFQDIVIAMSFSTQEVETLKHRLHFRRQNSKTGPGFIQYAKRLIRSLKPDVVVADPMLSYIGCGINEQGLITKFLRNGLQPMLDETGVIWIFLHHMGKPPRDNGRNNGASKSSNRALWALLGSSEILNWAREILAVNEIDWEKKIFEVEFSKRARQADLCDSDGKRCFTLQIKQSQTHVVWEPAGGEEMSHAKAAAKNRKTVDKDKVFAAVPLMDPEWKPTVEKRIALKLNVGEKKVERTLRELELEGKVFTRVILNPSGKGPSLRGWSRTPECGDSQNGDLDL